MGFIKFTKGTSLSDKDRKALQKLLGAEKKKLQSALKDVDAEHSMLGGAKKPRRRRSKNRRPGRRTNLQASVFRLSFRLGRSRVELGSRTSLRP